MKSAQQQIIIQQYDDWYTGHWRLGCDIWYSEEGPGWWRKYSGLVLCKSRGNSKVTASTSRHWKPQESSLWRWFHIAGKCHTGLGVALPVCDGGLGRGVGRSALLVVGFSVLVSILLRSLSMSGAALSTWLKCPGILFMTWQAQGVMNGWLLVFLSRMCCHKASWAVVRLVAFQGVRRKPCMLPPVGGNFDPT